LTIIASGYPGGPYENVRKELVEPGFLTVADPFTSPPSCYIDESGESRGYFVEIITGFAERIGVKPKIVTIDWPGVLPGLTSLRFDIGGCQVTQTVERLASDAFIGSTFFLGQGIKLLVLEGSDINEWNDIKSKKIGGQKGSAELKSVLEKYPSAKSKEYGTFTDIMLDVVNKRIEAGVIPEIILAGLIKENPKMKVKAVGDPYNVTTRGTFFAPTHVKMAKAFDEYVEELRASGKLDEMSEKWFGIKFDWDKLREAWTVTRAKAEELKKKK
jgi:ABC-type amino acid transport substrate-binding protein